MKHVTEIQLRLVQSSHSCNPTAFYKTGSGHYAEHDKFRGVNVPTLRKIARDFKDLSHDDIKVLIMSPFNEDRLLALFILIFQYETPSFKEECYQFYRKNLKYVNNWNLVDASAHLIMGEYLFKKERLLLLSLAASDSLWERRIAIVATWYFIRHNDLEWTFKISERLLNDSQDLIHKAVGWMLREAGKKDLSQLRDFLDRHISKMPRTMLRYAIEKFSESERRSYLLR